MQLSFHSLDEGSDAFEDDFEFVEIEPDEEENKSRGSNKLFSLANSRPGSESATPSTLTFPALYPNVNQLMPTPLGKPSYTKTPLLSDDPPLAKPVLSPPTKSTDNVGKEETPPQKENEPPMARSTLDAGADCDKPIKDPIRLEFDDVYSCKVCGTHVARETDVESKSFQVGEGPFTEAKRGYLFRSAVNLRQGPPRPEHFTTGIYTISYVECFTCGQPKGWKYLGSSTAGGRAKIGKFCLKCALLTREPS